MAAALDRLARGLSRAAEGVLFVLLGLICLLAFTQVVLRYLLTRALFWADELTLAAFTWMIFLAAARVLERRGHFGVNALVARLPGGLRRGVAVLVHGVMLGVVLFFLTLGIEHARSNWAQESDVLRMPMTWWYLALPVGSALMLVSLLRDLLLLLAGRPLPEAEDLG